MIPRDIEEENERFKLASMFNFGNEENQSEEFELDPNLKLSKKEEKNNMADWIWSFVKYS